MFAVPTVSRTKPQKIPAWRIPAAGSRNIRVWTIPYRIVPRSRAIGRSVGLALRAAAKTRRWRAIASTKNAAAPQNSGKTSG